MGFMTGVVKSEKLSISYKLVSAIGDAFTRGFIDEVYDLLTKE